MIVVVVLGIGFLIMRRANGSKPKYCCAQIGNPQNTWRDCNPCEKSKPLCHYLTSKDSCETGHIKGHCKWDNDKCTSTGIQFGQTIPCSDAIKTEVCIPRNA